MKLNYVASFISGLLFGAGLVVSGMANPQRVRGFLDIGGAFDPTLAFVMMGALLIMALAWRTQKKLSHPLFSTSFEIPKTMPVDWRLISGAILFWRWLGTSWIMSRSSACWSRLSPQKSPSFCWRDDFRDGTLSLG